jgi:hypothetical protein
MSSSGRQRSTVVDRRCGYSPRQEDGALCLVGNVSVSGPTTAAETNNSQVAWAALNSVGRLRSLGGCTDLRR